MFLFPLRRLSRQPSASAQPSAESAAQANQSLRSASCASLINLGSCYTLPHLNSLLHIVTCEMNTEAENRILVPASAI